MSEPSRRQVVDVGHCHQCDQCIASVSILIAWLYGPFATMAKEVVYKGFEICRDRAIKEDQGFSMLVSRSMRTKNIGFLIFRCPICFARL